jgi:hypothetical protein
MEKRYHEKVPYILKTHVVTADQNDAVTASAKFRGHFASFLVRFLKHSNFSSFFVSRLRLQ